MSATRSKKTAARKLRVKRSIRAKISGTTDRPRLCVYRSNKEIYAQLIDDVTGTTITNASSRDKGFAAGANKTETAAKIGAAIAQKGVEKGVSAVVFDRNGYLYHGRVKALAEGAREGGLKF